MKKIVIHITDKTVHIKHLPAGIHPHMYVLIIIHIHNVHYLFPFALHKISICFQIRIFSCIIHGSAFYYRDVFELPICAANMNIQFNEHVGEVGIT